MRWGTPPVQRPLPLGFRSAPVRSRPNLQWDIARRAQSPTSADTTTFSMRSPPRGRPVDRSLQLGNDSTIHDCTATGLPVPWAVPTHAHLPLIPKTLVLQVAITYDFHFTKFGSQNELLGATMG